MLTRALIPILLCLALVAGACGSDAEPAVLAGIQRSPLPEVGDLALPATDGTELIMRADEGGLLLVYFGYTSCPDVCPTTMSGVVQALDALGDEADDVAVMMVSIDPDRDSPAIVERYVQSFHPRFRGASGDIADVERVATLYGIFFARDEPTVDGEYTMSHTSTLLGIDPDGHLRIVWPTVLDPSRLAADIRELL